MNGIEAKEDVIVLRTSQNASLCSIVGVHRTLSSSISTAMG